MALRNPGSLRVVVDRILRTYHSGRRCGTGGRQFDSRTGVRLGYQEVAVAYSSMDNVRPNALFKAASDWLTLLRGARRSTSAWWWLGPIAVVANPSRVPPRGGFPPLWKVMLTVKLRTGRRLHCRLGEVFNVLEVYGLEVYAVPITNVKTIVDVGANIGSSVLWFHDRWPAAHILAIEPSAETAVRLRSNIDANSLSASVTTVLVAVGDSTGTQYLTRGRTSALRSLTDQPSETTETVNVTKLSTLLEEMDVRSVDLLKMDCEGGEYHVILADDGVRWHDIRAIVGEYHVHVSYSPDDLWTRLKSLGYEVDVILRCKVPGGEEGMFRAVRSQGSCVQTSG